MRAYCRWSLRNCGSGGRGARPVRRGGGANAAIRNIRRVRHGGGRHCLDVEGREPPAEMRRHGLRVDVEPHAARRIVFDGKAAGLAREAHHALQQSRRRRARIRRTAGRLHPTPVDQHRNRCARGPESRQHVEARAPVPGPALEQQFGRFPRAGQADAPPGVAGFDGGKRGQGRFGETRRRPVDQLPLPVPPVELPDAEPDQDRERRQDEQDERDARPNGLMPCRVMAGLVPAIHAAARRKQLREMPGTSPGMTEGAFSHGRADIERQFPKQCISCPRYRRPRTGTARRHRRNASTRPPPRSRNGGRAGNAP